MSILDDIKMYARFAWGLRGFLRHTITLEEARAIVRQRLAEREANFLRLVERSDVVAENFKAGTLDRLGIGYEQARQVNPRIIYGSINGFGSSGPYSDMPCVDPVAQAMGGLMSMTGFEGQPPLKTGPAVADSLSGLYLALGIMSALRQRDRKGRRCLELRPTFPMRRSDC